MAKRLIVKLEKATCGYFDYELGRCFKTLADAARTYLCDAFKVIEADEKSSKLIPHEKALTLTGEQ